MTDAERDPITYGTAILAAFEFLLTEYPNVFVIGQGLWSPWYVGNTMTGLDKRYGRSRIIDSPVSEQATTGVALGASLAGYRPIVTHPRVDFAVLALDQIVNQAAKWSSMFGGTVRAPVTFRCIINRGGEQGAQHSQSLYSWFAHIPGLRVVVPYSAKDAHDLLISSTLCNDPVVFMDDRWLYDLELKSALDSRQAVAADLRGQGPRVVVAGSDLTMVGLGYGTRLAVEAAEMLLQNHGLACEVIDLRVINPMNVGPILESVKQTGRLCVIEPDWAPCGIGSEVIASVSEDISASAWRSRPTRVTLPFAPAPTSRRLEEKYYGTSAGVVRAVMEMCSNA